MLELAQVILDKTPPSAIPLVVVIVVCFYIWSRMKTKFTTLEKDRTESKISRDKEVLELRDKCLSNEKELKYLWDAISERNNDIKELNQCVKELSTNMAVLTTEVKNLTRMIDGRKKDD